MIVLDNYNSKLICITSLILVGLLFLSSSSAVRAEGPLVCEPTSENLVLESGIREDIEINLRNTAGDILRVDISDTAENMIDFKYPDSIFIGPNEDNTINLELNPKKEGNFNTELIFISKAYTGCPSCGWNEVGQTEVLVRGCIVSPSDLSPPTVQSPVNGSKDSPGLVIQKEKIEVSGQGLAGTTLKSYLGGSESASTTVDWDGNWKATLSLSSGVNKIQFSTAYEGEESEKVLYGYVASDLEPPSLIIDTPENDVRTGKKWINIEGRASDNVTRNKELKIFVESPAYSDSKEIIRIDSDGSFSEYIPLVKGDNPVSLVVEDEAGRKNSISLNLIRKSSKTGNGIYYLSFSIVILIVVPILAIGRNVKRGPRRRRGM